MSRRPRGFWWDRPRRGQDDARLLTAERLHELRQLSYTQLRSRAGGGPAVDAVTGPSGESFRRRTSIERRGRGEAEELRIRIEVYDGSLLGRMNPLAEQLIIATQDGEMVGTYTMAGEGNDARRYRRLGGS